VDHEKWTPGIYHFSNEGIINWYQFAVAIREQTSAPATVQPIPSAQYPTPAARPAYSVLDNSKIITTFGIVPRPWKESLQECLLLLPAAQ
jgi:dTDP-4-dehydrorhamnose reductase